MYNYRTDELAHLCLDRAYECRTNIGFGAVLLDRNYDIIGRGRNRRSTEFDRSMISHVDYAIHAEQDAVLNAIIDGHDVRDTGLYVLGVVLSGKNKGELTVRNQIEFGCRKCPHTFLKYNIHIHIPYIDGWRSLTPEFALESGCKFHGHGTWNKFVNGEVQI